MRRIGRPAAVLLATIAAATLLRGFVAASTGLTDDEAYYRLWALAPAMSYLDHPPMVGWMIAAGRYVAGDSPLAIRLAAVLTGLVGPLVLWRTALILFDADVARRATWFALAMPLLAVGGIVITPDTPSALFWGLLGWALAELHASRNANWWLAAGLFAGLGLLSKYTNLLAGVGILAWLVGVPESRRWLRAWQLWAGGLLAGLLALPVVAWNATHGWASFAKQFGRVAPREDFTASYLLEFVGAFIALASPLLAVLALLGLCQVVGSAVARRDQACSLVAASVVPLLAYCLLHAVHARVQPNWIAPIYPALAICAALVAGSNRPRPRIARGLRDTAGWTLAIGFTMSGVLCLHAVRPLVLLPGSRDPTSQMRGWTEFAADVDRLRAANGACWIATSSYTTTGQLAYHLPSRAPVVQLDERIRYVHLPPVDGRTLACPALYVDLTRHPSSALLQQRFRSVTALGSRDRSYRGLPLADYAVYLVRDPRDSAFADMPGNPADAPPGR